MALIGQKVKYGGKSFSIVSGPEGPGFWITKGGEKVFIKVMPGYVSRGYPVSKKFVRGTAAAVRSGTAGPRTRKAIEDQCQVEVKGDNRRVKISELGRVLDRFYDYYALDVDENGDVIEFSNTLDFVHLSGDEWLEANVVGNYDGDNRSIVVSRDAGIGTVAHELGHAIYKKATVVMERGEENKLTVLVETTGSAYDGRGVGDVPSLEYVKLVRAQDRREDVFAGKWQWIPSGYSTSNKKEYFAECFAFYALSPEIMKKRMPDMYRYFEKVFGEKVRK